MLVNARLLFSSMPDCKSQFMSAFGNVTLVFAMRDLAECASGKLLQFVPHEIVVS